MNSAILIFIALVLVAFVAFGLRELIQELSVAYKRKLS